jgi:histidine ammonia-lyase
VDDLRLLLLDGCTLRVEDLVDCSKGAVSIQVSSLLYLCIGYVKNAVVFFSQLSPSSREKIHDARRFLEKIADEHKIVYGITTGFGTFSNVEIPREDLKYIVYTIILY